MVPRRSLFREFEFLLGASELDGFFSASRFWELAASSIEYGSDERADWLIAADWLEDHGSARAQVLREYADDSLSELQLVNRWPDGEVADAARV